MQTKYQTMKYQTTKEVTETEKLSRAIEVSKVK